MRHDCPIGPYLYLPVEVASRELHAKLLLAYFAVRMGYEVVIGWKKLMNRNFHQMPPGIVVFKTLTGNDGEVMLRAHAGGHGVVAIDEEVPGLVATEQKLRWVTPESVAASDLVFAVGANHLEALRELHPRHAERYRVVGNPRWDLLRPELRGSHVHEAEAIREKYGPFVLINTNFAVANSARRTAKETRDWFVKTMRVDPSKPDDLLFLDEIYAMERANTEAIQQLVRCLPARFPDHRFIVRPHPMERTDTWDAVLGDVPRAEMVRTGAAVSWILASDVLVHTNCTTGVEAFALDKPAVSLQPAELGIYKIYLSNRINYLAMTVDEALHILDGLVGPGSSWPGYPPEFRETFDHFFAATRGPFACQRILEAIGERFQPKLSPDAPAPSWRPSSGYLQRTRTREHHSRVMPDIDATTVAGVLHDIGAALGDRAPFHVEPCGQLVFHVHGAAAAADHRLPGELGARLHRLLPPWRASAPKGAH